MSENLRHLSRSSLVALVFLSVVSGNGVVAGSGTVGVPIRWCVVEGSPSAVMPQCNGANTTNKVILRRQGRTTGAHYMPYCNMKMRSAAEQQQPIFPIIADPCDPTLPNSTCLGAKGDIVYGTLEVYNVRNACETAWNSLNLSAAGPIGVNIRRFVDGAGGPSNVLGQSSQPEYNNPGQQASSWFVVMDDDLTFPVAPAPPGCLAEAYNDPTEQILGHEFGHAVSLPHDPSNANPITLMHYGFPSNDFLTSGGPGQTDTVCPNPIPTLAQLTSQCGRARVQSMCLQNGVDVDPPPVVDEQPLEIGNASPAWIDLWMIALIDDSQMSTATFAWEVGLSPRTAQALEYAFAMDLDHDPNTGGDPAILGVAIPLQGAELVGKVQVDIDQPPGQEKQFTTTGTIWKFSGGSFQQRPVIRSRAADLNLESYQALPLQVPIETPFNTRIALDFDRSLLELAPGLVPSALSFQASAADPQALTLSPSRDLPPAGTLFLVTPNLPVCVLTPDLAQAGTGVAVAASGLAPGQTTEVLLDNRVVAVGTTDGSGRTSSQFLVPNGAVPGEHAITILTDDPGSAVTADCTLTILGSDPGAGAVPDGSQMPGAPLDVTLAAAGDITLSWGGSCLAGDIDYEIYEGVLGSFTSHASRFCSTAGATSLTFDPASGNTYYIVVPANGLKEGSYGRMSNGLERPQGLFPCKPQEIATCH